MAVIEEKPITLAEVYEKVEDSEKGKEIKKFIRNFTKMSAKEAISMKEELRSLNIIKLKEAHIVKIVDFKPCDAIELNKVVGDISLESEEVSKILDVVKKY